MNEDDAIEEDWSLELDFDFINPYFFENADEEEWEEGSPLEIEFDYGVIPEESTNWRFFPAFLDLT